MGTAKRDLNMVTTLIGVSSVDGITPVAVWVDPVTHRVLIQGASGGTGTVTSVSVVTANGVSGSVATATTTPAITLTLGAITPTSVNGLTITSTTGTLTITNAKTLSVSNTLTFTGTDGSSVAFGAGGTVAYVANNLSVFAATTSAQLAGVISDETGSGALVFANTPTLVTPVLGVATATSINGLTITSSTGTLTITNAKTLSVSNTLTFTGTDSSSVAFGAGGTVAYVANKLSVFAATSSSELAGVISDETGTGALVFGTSPTFTTSIIPAANTAIIGNTTTGWATLYMTSTGALNFGNGNVTITHASGTLTLVGELILPSTGPSSTLSVGYRGVPQNSKSAAYTTVLADAGCHIYHPAGDANARTFTIDSNANVAYPIGTAITFVNETSQVVTIAITTDTLVLAGTGTTGSRSLAQYGVATALKVTSTRWIISGTGLS